MNRSRRDSPVRSASIRASEWRGTERFEVGRCLGAGGMGLVYEAFDRKLGQFVALKTLLRFTPSALYCIKQEFRTLADVIHPNLVTLHELVATKDDDVFFTMELVRGVDFVTHALRPEARSRHRARRHPTTLPTLSSAGVRARPHSPARIR